jgi:hypothetical protein
MILERKDEVRRLMEEDEDGMIHSLLSSFPALADELEPNPSSQPQLVHPTGVVDHHLPSPEDVETDAEATVVVDPESSHVLTDETDATGTEGTPIFSPPPDSDLTLVDSDLGTVDDERAVKEDMKEEKSDGVEGATDYIDAQTTPTKQSSLPTKKPLANAIAETVNDSAVAVNTLDTSSSTSLQPENDTLSRKGPRTLIRSLPSLLTHASNLETLFPPSHPSLHLSQIMGPQSVIHTWSENFKDWPSDNDAEGMVTHMDLIVYPDYQSDVSDGSSETDEDSNEEAREKNKGGEKKKRRNRLTKKWKPRSSKRGGKHKHKKRKYPFPFTFKLPGGKLMPMPEKRTMVAGAVLVLGIGMAMYSAGKGGGGRASTEGLGRGSAGGGFGFGKGAFSLL